MKWSLVCVQPAVMIHCRLTLPLKGSRIINYDENIMSSTDRIAADNFITLADLCNRRQRGTCQWIFNHHRYQQWLQGSFRTLYCLGSGKFIIRLSSFFLNMRNSLDVPF
jgi:hypothetical protein